MDDIRKEVPVKRRRKHLCAGRKRRKSTNLITNGFFQLKVLLEKSAYIEHLIIQQQFLTLESDKMQTLSNVDFTPLANKSEVLDKCDQAAPQNKIVEMNNENKEEPLVIPTNLPMIQITVKNSGEKVTRLISTKKPVPKRSWKRKSSDWMDDILLINSYKSVFSNAILGKEDLTTFPFCNVPHSPKKSRLSLWWQAGVSGQCDLSDSGIVTASEASTPEKNFNDADNLSNPDNAIRVKLPQNIVFNKQLCAQEKSNISSVQENDNQNLTVDQSDQLIDLNLSSMQVVKQTENKVPIKVYDDSDVKDSVPQKHSPIHFVESDSLEKAKNASDGIKLKKQNSEQIVGINRTFKLPLLPKRPPGRIQRGRDSNKKITDLRALLQKNRRQPEDTAMITNNEDDAISLYAESLILEPNQPEKKTATSFPAPILLETVSCSDVHTHQPQQDMDPVNAELIAAVTEFLNQEHRSETTAVASKNPTVKDWIANTEKKSSTSIDTNRLLVGYCYSFLGKGVCYKPRCAFKHDLRSLPSNFNDLSEVEFQKLLKKCASFHYIFKIWLDAILNYMSEHGRQDLVLHLVFDVMRMPDNKMPFIKKIILTLKNMGFTFDQAINEILLTIGRQNECLLDILLSFAVDEEDCVKTSWSLIANLTNFRQQALDSGVVQDIFRKCVECEPPDKNFCENVYKDIIVKNNFDLSKIDRPTLLKYISLLMAFQLDSNALHLMANYDIKKDEIAGSPQQIFSPISSINSKTSVKSRGRPGSPPAEVFECLDDIEFDESVTKDIAEGEQIDESMFVNTYLPTYNSNYSRQEVAHYLDNVRSDDSGNSSQKYSLFSCNNANYEGYYTQQPAPYVPRSRKNSSCSLHEYMPKNTVKKKDLSEMTDNDIISLVAALRNNDWANLLSIIKKYSEREDTVRHLVIQILAAIKSLSIDKFCQLVSNIFRTFGDYCQSDYKIVNVLRLLGFNLMPILDREKQYKAASEVLKIFTKDYHSFIKYDFVTKNYVHPHLTTRDLKYVFLFKLFTRCERYKEGLRLLKHPGSKLLSCFLDGSESNPEIKEYKLRILSEFVKAVLESNLLDAKELVIYLLLNIGIERWPELKLFVNVLMSSMLKDYSIYKSEMQNMFDNVLNCWFKYLKPSVLRAYLINLYKDVSEKKILELFHLCLDVGIYRAHEGIENSISIPSDLLQEEIYLLVHHHFLKICGSKFPVSSIVIKVEESLSSDEYSKLHTVLIGSQSTSSVDMVRRILNVLKLIKNFPDIATLETTNQYIVLPCNHQFLQPYEKAAKGGQTPPLLRLN